MVYEKNISKESQYSRYIRTYTDCWQLEPDARPSTDQVLLQLQSMSLEPVFDDSDENSEEISKNYLQNYDPFPVSPKNSSGIILIFCLKKLLFFFFSL